MLLFPAEFFNLTFLSDAPARAVWYTNIAKFDSPAVAGRYRQPAFSLLYSSDSSQQNSSNTKE
jgi:hypothetical protein